MQHFYGGIINAYEPKKSQLSEAKKYVEHHAKETLYARVDDVMIGTNFHLMELELREPYLFLDISAGAYERYYNALLEKISLA